MNPPTVYEKPTCSTCRRVIALLQDRGIEFRRVNYFEEPFDEATLQAVLHRAQLRPRDVVRLKEAGAGELDLDDDDEILAALVRRPDLLQRPLVDSGDRAVLARPPERVLDLLA